MISKLFSEGMKKKKKTYMEMLATVCGIVCGIIIFNHQQDGVFDPSEKETQRSVLQGI